MTLKTDEEIIEEFETLIAGKSAAGRAPKNLNDMMDSFGCFTFGVFYAEGRHPEEAVDIGNKLVASDWMQPFIKANNDDVIATLLATPLSVVH